MIFVGSLSTNPHHMRGSESSEVEDDWFYAGVERRALEYSALLGYLRPILG